MAVSEIHNILRSAYFSGLSGEVEVDGKEINFSDTFVRSEQEYPYVILSTQVSVEEHQKCCKQFQTTILLDINTGFHEPTGRDEAEEIARQIQEIVNPCDNKTHLETSDDQWFINTTELENYTDSAERNDPYYVYRKLLRFNHLVTYKKN